MRRFGKDPVPQLDAVRTVREVDAAISSRTVQSGSAVDTGEVLFEGAGCGRAGVAGVPDRGDQVVATGSLVRVVDAVGAEVGVAAERLGAVAVDAYQ